MVHKQVAPATSHPQQLVPVYWQLTSMTGSSPKYLLWPLTQYLSITSFIVHYFLLHRKCNSSDFTEKFTFTDMTKWKDVPFSGPRLFVEKCNSWVYKLITRITTRHIKISTNFFHCHTYCQSTSMSSSRLSIINYNTAFTRADWLHSCNLIAEQFMAINILVSLWLHHLHK